MKLNKTIGRVATTLVATAMLASLAAPAYAAPNNAVTGQTIFQVNLDMTNAEGAGKPNVSFTYEIDDDATAVPANEETKTPEIKAGEFPEGTTSPLTATADWSNATYTADSDSETEGNQPCYTADVKVNFPAGTFTEPGIYRFTVTPEQSDSTYAGVNVDETVRYIDVYVAYPLDQEGNVNQNAAVEITAVKLVNKDSNATTDGENVNYTSKQDAYMNTFTTYDVTITKNVAGQMGDKSKEFNFSIDVTDPNATAVLSSVTLQNANATSASFASKENGTSVANVVADLHHTESVVIKGVPKGATVDIDETNADGYTISYSENAANGQATVGTEDVAVTVTNTRNAVTPTGIVMDIAPYALLVVIAAAGCFVFLRKRRED